MSNLLQRLAWVVAIVLFAIGSYGLYLRVTVGHAAADYGSYVPWGLWVAGYIYLIGLSAGAFLFSTLVYVFNIHRTSAVTTVAAPPIGMADGTAVGRSQMEAVGKLALLTALVTLVAAMVSIWLDLGHPERAWRLMFHTNFSSMMGWMAWLYSAYFVVLVVELWFALRTDLAACAKEQVGFKAKLCGLLTFGQQDTSEKASERDKKALRILGTLAVPLAIAFHGGVGALFGVIGARPYWNSAITPITFIVGALTSGGALITFVTAIWGPDRGTESHRQLVSLLGQIVLGLLLIDLLLEWAEYSIALYASIPAHAASLQMILFGPYWWVFWIVHVLLGSVVPLLLLTFWRHSVAAVATATALLAITFISVRLNIVIPGLAVEELEGLSAAFTGPGLTFSYFPTTMEWLVFIWSIALAGLLFLTGYNLLPIVRTKKAA